MLKYINEVNSDRKCEKNVQGKSNAFQRSRDGVPLRDGADEVRGAGPFRDSAHGVKKGT